MGKVMEGGIVKRVKSGKKIVEGKEGVMWEIVEDVMKGDGVLLKGGGRVEGVGMEGLKLVGKSWYKVKSIVKVGGCMFAKGGKNRNYVTDG